MSRGVRIGTRGSELALWQARKVASLLAALPGAPAPIEIVPIETTGDRALDLPLSQAGSKAFFTQEIEEALLAGRVDLAVHSLKDLPTELPPGLALGAVLERDDPRDVLVSRGGVGVDGLPRGARVGTSSLRRRALLARWRGDLDLVELRGNVPTRVARVDQGRYDAIVLAAAGLRRLGLEARIAETLPLDRMLPAAGQGALAVEIRAGDEETTRLVRRLVHAPTLAAISSERALLAELEGGCQVPVGALGTVEGEELTLRGVICSLDGTRAVEGGRRGAVRDAGKIGVELARALLAEGGSDILAAIRGGGGGT